MENGSTNERLDVCLVLARSLLAASLDAASKSDKEEPGSAHSGIRACTVSLNTLFVACVTELAEVADLVAVALAANRSVRSVRRAAQLCYVEARLAHALGQRTRRNAAAARLVMCERILDKMG